MVRFTTCDWMILEMWAFSFGSTYGPQGSSDILISIYIWKNPRIQIRTYHLPYLLNYSSITSNQQTPEPRVRFPEVNKIDTSKE